MILKRVLLIAAVVLSCGVALHLYLLDGLLGWSLATFYQDDTQYAGSYSDAALRRITVGMDEGEVLAHLGPPVREAWGYATAKSRESVVHLDGGHTVVSVSDDGTGVKVEAPVGVDSNELVRSLGAPAWKSWSYTTTPGDSSYRVRVVQFRGGQVSRLIHEYYLD